MAVSGIWLDTNGPDTCLCRDKKWLSVSVVGKLFFFTIWDKVQSVFFLYVKEQGGDVTQ